MTELTYPNDKLQVITIDDKRARIGIGAYLDGRTRIQWLMPLLVFAYMYNILICTKALLDLFAAKILGKNQSDWAKTHHLGNGNSYIAN